MPNDEEEFDWSVIPTVDPSDPEYVLRWRECFDKELSSNLDEARGWIHRCCGSDIKLEALMHLHGQMDFPDWLVLLGDLWSNCDNIGLYSEDLTYIIKEFINEPLTMIPELMSTEEKLAFDLLPKQITIYRGCGPKNKLGMSWSLRREVAERFPFTGRYRADQPTLLTAKIGKDRVAALKMERNEQEIIVVDMPESCCTEEYITKPPPLLEVIVKDEN